MHSQKSYLIIGILSLTFLASCGKEMAPSVSPDERGPVQTDNMDQAPQGDVKQSATPRGTGTTTQISAEDQALMTEMLRARRKGDNQRADEIEAKLSAKYPTLRFAGTASSPEKINAPEATSTGKITSNSGTSASGSTTVK